MNMKFRLYSFFSILLVVFGLGCDAAPAVHAEPVQSSSLTCDFEHGVGPWHTSESHASVSIDTAQAHTGTHSLKVAGYIAGNASATGKNNAGFTHLEPKYYFDQDQNLLGQTRTVYVWIPRAFTGKGIYMRAYGFTSGTWGNQYGDVVNWTYANATGWVPVSVTFRQDTENPDFNPEEVGGFGVRIELYNGKKFEGNVHAFIDC